MTTSNKSGKLLVVDTSTAMLHVLKNFTGKHGYDADHFSDPADACERLDQRFQDFSCDYRSVVLGWPEGRLNLVHDLLQKLSTPDHDALPLTVITQEMNAEVRALVKRRPKTRAFLWSEYQQVSEIIDLTVKHQSKRKVGKAVISASAQPGQVRSVETSAVEVSGGESSDAASTATAVDLQGVAAQALPQSNVMAADYRTDFSLLLVDTAPSICESLRGKLESSGYQISIAGSVSEARKQLAENEFDVVVTDFFLRDESGEALCQQLQASEMNNKPVCVVLTAKYSDSIVKRSLAVGAAACLYKNESTELLFARIDALTRTMRRQSRQLSRLSVRQQSHQQTQQQTQQQTRQQAQQSALSPQMRVARTGSSKEGLTASLHTTTQTRLQETAETTNGAQRSGVVELVTRQIAEKPAINSNDSSGVGVAPTVDSAANKAGRSTQSKPSLPVKPPLEKPVEKDAEFDVSVPLSEALAQLKSRNPAAHYSMLMLDIDIVAATGDRMALADSEPMQNLVARSLCKLYPKQRAQACTEDGKFVLLLTTRKYQDALVLTRKILQLIPKMVPYLNNMNLVAHAGILRIDKDDALDQRKLVEQCEAACQKARKDGKDNAALVLPNNQYLSAVIPAVDTGVIEAQAPDSEASVKAAVPKAVSNKTSSAKAPAANTAAAKNAATQEEKKHSQTA